MSGRSADALTAKGAALLFGLCLWASVSLALYVTFWLELDNPFWAGTSAAIVCHHSFVVNKITTSLGSSDERKTRGSVRPADLCALTC